MLLTFSIDKLYSKTHKTKASVLMGPYPFYLDHSAPICALLDIPLLITDPKVKFQYEPLYPGLKCQIKNWDLRYLVEHFSTIFYPFKPEPSFARGLKKAQEKDPNDPLWSKEMKFIYHLHGCSDKGYHSDWIAPKSHFLDVDQVLLYGKRMADLFEDNQVLFRLKSYAFTGNYRYVYFLKHQAFYRSLIQEKVMSKFHKEKPTLLYAPSWNDPEGSGSLFKAHKWVIDQLPNHYNLIVKAHPYFHVHLKDSNYDEYQTLLKRYSSKPNVLFLENFPLIYPLLDQVVGYIGDYSSIGYDALAFSLPLFFLNHNERNKEDKGAYLHRCGQTFTPKDFSKLYEEIEKSLKQPDPYQEIKEKTYEYAFGKLLSYKVTQELFQSFLSTSKEESFN